MVHAIGEPLTPSSNDQYSIVHLSPEKLVANLRYLNAIVLYTKFQIGPHMAARVKNANTTNPSSPKLCNLFPHPFAQLNDPSLFPRIKIVITLLLIRLLFRDL